MGSKKATIMIVEDEFITAMLLEQTLKKRGFDAFNNVASGEDAVLIAEKKRPDIILMDIRLAGKIDGIEATERIMSFYRPAIVFMTGYGDEELRQRAMKLNPLSYQTKPLYLDKMIDIINAAV